MVNPVWHCIYSAITALRVDFAHFGAKSKLEKEGKIRLGDNGEPQTEEAEAQKLTDNWTDWVGYSSIWGFTTENHEKVIERAIITSSHRWHDNGSGS